MRTLLGLLLLCGMMIPAVARAQESFIEQMAEPGRAERRQALITHGITPAAASLVRFLENGFSEPALARGLPRDPRIKTELINLAIQELGFIQAREAVPVLVRILGNEMPMGVRLVMQYDLEGLPLDAIDEERNAYADFIRYNTLVSLGLIGDPAAVPHIREALRVNPPPPHVIEGAISLGLLGDVTGLDNISELLRQADSDIIPAAFNALFYLTGRNYSVTEQTSIARRREAISRHREWHTAEAHQVALDRSSIMRRRLRGVEPERLPAESLRGALRLTMTFEDYDGRFAAREYLRGIAPQSIPELKAIATDPMEDLDIRQAAMQWYAAADPRGARSDIRNMSRRDENQVIRERATVLEQDIEEALRASR